jgi:hypothetical protein
VGYLNTSGAVIKFLRESMELNILNRSTDYMTRLEKKETMANFNEIYFLLGVLRVLETLNLRRIKDYI